MASLIKMKKTGRWKIQFVNGERRRKTLYAGKMPRKAAESIQAHVEALLSAVLSRSSPEAHTAAWLGNIPPRLHDKLVRLGLATPRADEAPPPSAGLTVKEFIADYLEKRAATLKE
jgi:hypothetical protein